MRFAEVDGALPALPLTQGLVEGWADQQAPAFGPRGLRRAQRLLGCHLGLRCGAPFALLHAQVQRAVLIHLDEHVLQAHTEASDTARVWPACTCGRRARQNV